MIATLDLFSDVIQAVLLGDGFQWVVRALGQGPVHLGPQGVL